MNDKIRNILKFLALDVDYSIFMLCVLLIHPEKFKENIITKVLRIFIILFNTIAFPLCTQIFAKSLVPKGGKLAAYPDVSFFEGRQLFLLLDVVSFILYLLFQFIVSFATVILRAYKADFACFIFIVMFLYIIYETYELLTTHPYYHKHVNNLRAGMWTMVLGMSIVDLFALLFGKGKSFFSIILPIVGVCSFVIGFLLSIYQYKKHIEAIYKRYKTKRLEEKYRYNRDHGITSSNDSENESQVSSENDHNEKLISVDSYDSSGNINNKKKHNKKQEVEESEESEEEDDDSSHSGSFVLNDRISERITSFGSLREIVNDKVSNEPIIVYNYVNEFELACRFIWSNETNEAFQLMKELYEESLDQYINNPLLYTFYSYYLLYIDARLSKSDKENLLNSNKKKKVEKIKNEEEKGNSEYDYISENENENDNENESEDNENDEYENEPEPEDNKNEEALNEDEINCNNPDYLLSKALGLKLNYFQRYFVIYLTLDINEKKKEDKDYYKKESVEILARLQHEAVEKHITILNILKKFFSNVKSINSNDNKAEAFNMDMFLEAFYYLKKQTLSLYQEIISKYPEEKSTYQLYTLFMTEVVKYMLNEGDSYMALNGPDGAAQQKFRGSQSSFGVSNAGGSSFGESENKKRRMLK
ncbi:hypothetical protein BCR32DRAFT_251421 [Anaeromyces robustus]|uniref:Uncharacterized protein n=1 Tax=Anaeromyces robustus TaxID=1754192 RepID=A0A1Y1VR99_9FUNG|nr:hypothetical protein BCR32DRAFT_251421 [Anaeromyces robustus]|eukprot:ORX63808.1 hypothetical protein BCR32DRAFT_251421 [Anaeromyces robustus]